MKTVALLPAHPSQVWVLNQVAKQLSRRVRVLWYLRDKDRSGEIADGLGIKYKPFSIAATGLFRNGAEMFFATMKALQETQNNDIDLWVTKFGAGNIAAKLLRRKSLSFNDDDLDLVPLIGATSYRFADKVLVLDVTRMGRYEVKACRYPSFHELFYLHPSRFLPDHEIKQELGLLAQQRFGVVRLSALTAHHDRGIRGIATEFLVKFIKRYETKIKIFISSEKPLAPELAQYQLSIRPERMHHVLAFAEFFVGDSQTMAAEAAVLGTPALRLNDFAGRVSYLAELERYGLAFSFRPGEEHLLIKKLDSMLCNPSLADEFKLKKEKMLVDKIDPAPWFADRITQSLGLDY